MDQSSPAASAGAPEDVAVAQMLALAELANVSFDLAEGKLVMQCAHLDRAFWPPVRRCLDELGIEAIVRYFQRNDRSSRAALAAVPA